MRRIAFLFAVTIFATYCLAMATVFRVPSEYPTIQAGIDAAVDGDTVLVAEGIYTGDGNRDIKFKGKAIRVASESGPESCIIDCQGSESDPHRGFIFNDLEISNTVLEGFKITNGWAFEGGGVYCDHSSPTIVNNIIMGNTAVNRGGGISCQTYANAAIHGNTIRENSADDGGGIYSARSSPHILGNIIVENIAEHAGGAIYSYDSPLTIESNILIGNTSNFFGGGICCYRSSMNIVGNVIAGNVTPSSGGGIYCRGEKSPTIEGNTLTANKASYGGGICCSSTTLPIVSSSILWGDSATIGKEIYIEDSSIWVMYSDIEGGWEGEGNIDADPLFVLPGKRDYRLLWGSPCIDSGHPDSLDPDGTRSDMGAFFFDKSVPITIYLTPDTTVVTRKSNLGVTYTVINIDPDPLTFSLQTDVYLPNGKPYPGNPVVGPMEITLAAEETKQRWIKHYIPGYAPLGVYTYTCTINSIPFDDIIDEDSFSFIIDE